MALVDTAAKTRAQALMPRLPGAEPRSLAQAHCHVTTARNLDFRAVLLTIDAWTALYVTAIEPLAERDLEGAADTLSPLEHAACAALRTPIAGLPNLQPDLEVAAILEVACAAHIAISVRRGRGITISRARAHSTSARAQAVRCTCAVD